MTQMGLVGGLLCLATLQLAGCQAEVADPLPVRSEITSCESGRLTTFRLLRDVQFARAVAVAYDGSYLMFDTFPATQVVRVGADGQLLGTLANPFSQPVTPEHAAALPDGGWIVGSRARLARIDDQGERIWEVTFGPTPEERFSFQPLPEGGVILAAIIDGDEHDGNAPDSVLLLRFDEAGTEVWRQLVAFDGPLWSRSSSEHYELPTLTLGSDGRLRFVVQSHNGLVILSSDLDGNSIEQKVLDTRLAFQLVATVELPDERLAIASERGGAILSIVDYAGKVLSEHSYRRFDHATVSGIAYDAVRQQVVVSGGVSGEDESARSRTWLLATDLDGEPQFELEREALELGVNGALGEVRPEQGPALGRLAVAKDGSLLAAASAGGALGYLFLGGEPCQ